ncbi:MAG TPA: class I SAM-dependent methyltransferase [Solirubrobacteraceae bacterium]|jgi:SAM-dependent methyltransferase|nr:class I SAM-dependent methyltransferase [Solirubrobacteraceae bacterium]
MSPPEAEVIWHDLECGGYRADLCLWRELAESQASQSKAATVLDIGAGTGRVALDLAALGHHLTALDHSPQLLGALSDRAREAGLEITTARADARRFALSHQLFDLCLVPMQTLQLLRGASERRALFAAARAHLRPGGLLALAIVTDVDPFDSRTGDLGPAPERATIVGGTYLSRAVQVECRERFIRIERERLVMPPGGERPPAEIDVIELERLDELELWAEGRAEELLPEPTVTIPETDEHSGSEVVMLRA